MRVIAAPSLGRAHELVVKMILEKGWMLETENGEQTIEYEPIGIAVNHPATAPQASPASRFQQRFLDQYAEHLLHGSAAKFEYDYHGRLYDWGERLCSEGHEVHIDQIAYISKKLQSAPSSRRAIAVTWNPVIDESLGDCPCLQIVQCLIRSNELQMHVVFRSNDMLSAAGANMYALVRLQQSIASELGVACGVYTHISLVPHIYYVRDLNDIPAFCKEGEAIQPMIGLCSICRRCSRGQEAVAGR
jgi:thymidylate synthase